jgi:hypothetical protein
MAPPSSSRSAIPLQALPSLPPASSKVIRFRCSCFRPGAHTKHFAVITVCCTLIYLFFCIERYGRRTGLLAGSFVQALTLFILGGILSKHPAIPGGHPSSAGMAMIAMVCSSIHLIWLSATLLTTLLARLQIYLYIVIFSFTWGPVKNSSFSRGYFFTYSYRWFASSTSSTGSTHRKSFPKDSGRSAWPHPWLSFGS